MTTPPERHLSGASFSEYLAANIPIELPVKGNPRVSLFIDPESHRIGLRGPDGPATPSTTLRNVTIRRIAVGTGRAMEIAVTDPALFTDAYPVLCAIADRIQLDRYGTAQALQETLRRYGHLLEFASVLSREEETGLLGELCILDALATTTGILPAIHSWRGSLDEEHDFGLDGYDIEVKTTTSENQRHWISSLTQLVPSPGRSLWLISLQVTAGGADGVTLAALIHRIRAAAGAHGVAELFNQLLRGTPWRDSYATRPANRWQLRAQPTAHLVEGGFPRLTPDILIAAGVDRKRIPGIRYQIDLTSLPPSAPPHILADCLTATRLETP